MFTHFTSDTHYGHAAVIKYSRRPFSTIEEMNAELERRYCEVVDENSFVLWVGDVSFQKPSWTKALLDRLPGRKALVRGNHDKSVSLCLRMGFEIVTEVMFINILGHKVTVCHYPPAGATKDVRYPDRRPMKPQKGEYLIHGHTHESEFRVGRRFHVGVDGNDFRPVPLEKIAGEIGVTQISEHRWDNKTSSES